MGQQEREGERDPHNERQGMKRTHQNPATPKTTRDPV